MQVDHIQELFNHTWYRSGHSSKRSGSMDMIATARNRWFLKHTRLDLRSSSFFELGSGDGHFYAFLKAAGVTDYICCDTNNHLVQSMVHSFPELATRASHRDVLDTIAGLPKDSLACIVALMVLEHLHDNHFIGLFSAMVSRLKRGGEIWINVPSAESIISQYIRYTDLSHKRSFTLQNFIVLSKIFELDCIAVTGRIVPVGDIKTLIIYLHERLLYVLNRFLFAFAIGLHASLGVFSTELNIILRKK